MTASSVGHRRLALGLVFALMSTAAACGSEEGSSPGGTRDDAGDAAEFYEEEGLRITTSNDAGGGFDFAMRTVGGAVERICGIGVTAQNLPGGGGTLGDNTLWTAEPDGSTIGLLNFPGHVFAQLAGNEAVQYDFAEWEWLGRVAGVAPVLTVGTNSGYETVDDLRNSEEPIQFAVEGRGSDAFLGVTLASQVLGFPVEIVTGYGGPGEMAAAILRQEVDGTFESVDAALPGIESGDTRALTIFAEEPDPRLPEVPTATEVAEGDQDILAAFGNIYALERVFAAPPGTPTGRVDFLRDCLTEVFNDEQFQEEYEQGGYTLSTLPGSEVEEAAAGVVDQAEQLVPLIGAS